MLVAYRSGGKGPGWLRGVGDPRRIPAPVLMCRGRPSPRFPEVLLVAFIANLLAHRLCRRGRQGLAGAEHPDATFLLQRHGSPNWPKHDGFSIQLEIEHVTCV